MISDAEGIEWLTDLMGRAEYDGVFSVSGAACVVLEHLRGPLTEPVPVDGAVRA